MDLCWPGEGNGNPLSILVWKIPTTEEPGGLYSPWGRKESETTEQLSLSPVFLPGEFHGQRSLVGYSPWGQKELDRTEAT